MVLVIFSFEIYTPLHFSLKTTQQKFSYHRTRSRSRGQQMEYTSWFLLASRVFSMNILFGFQLLGEFFTYVFLLNVQKKENL